MSAPTEDHALVLFTGQTDIPWLRLLRPGFRHCSVLLRLGEGWLLYNPLSHWTEVSLAGPWLEADLTAWLERHGYTVVSTRRKCPPPVAAPWGPYTCVEAVKRVLGLRAPLALTPWRLFRHLQLEAQKGD